jgi:DNA-binding MarR family transcriptional regulator
MTSSVPDVPNLLADAEPLPPPGGLLSEEHITVLMVGIGLRLNRGAAAYYRAAFDLGMTEWRLLLVLDRTKALNVGELSAAVDLDKAAVSRSLALLEQRGLIAVEQTRTRGRAAFAGLTAEGARLCTRLRKISRQRQDRLLADFSGAEIDQLRGLLQRLTLALNNGDWLQQRRS